eukprot:2601468-Rhodomonas_salina.1
MSSAPEALSSTPAWIIVLIQLISTTHTRETAGQLLVSFALGACRKGEDGVKTGQARAGELEGSEECDVT